MNALSVKNIKLFIAFRVFFNARFYYPVFTVLFLDFGLSLEQFAVLNVIWAASIVLFEVPTGSLADCIGRKSMILIAAIIMTLEILLLVLLPVGSNSLVFWGFFINRILSGAAEAFCSGADEALAYDSLKKHNLQDQWPKVLKRLMRIQSVAFIFALIIGSLVYDSKFINSLLSVLNISITIDSQISMKFPLYLMLISCAVAIYCSSALEEQPVSRRQNLLETVKSSLLNIKDSANWIFKTQSALMLITAGMIFDCVIRMFLTLNSEYYRAIMLPVWSFGLFGALLSFMGFFVPSFSTYLLNKKSKGFNFIVCLVLCFTGLVFMSFCIPYWGILAVAIIYISMYNINFLLSHYLNKIAVSEIRATILSFKSLAFNLAYGFTGIFYALLADKLEEKTLNKDLAFVNSLFYIPYFFVFLILCYTYIFRKRLAAKWISHRE